MLDTAPIRINPDLDVEALAEAFRRDGRVHAPDFLSAESAERLHRALAEARNWSFVFNRGNEHFELTPDQARRMPPEAARQMQRDIMANARDGFQLAYEVLNISRKTSECLTDDPTLRALHAFLNGPDYLGFMARLTGQDRGAWCDATATRYGPGHFCEMHDDRGYDGERLAAFVLNLTPRWRVDWGGVLMFVDERGHVSGGLTPSFNALNAFRVPQPHLVSAVAPFAGADRLSITGWLRPQA